MKAIYIHSHMDEENFDVARVMKCPVGVPQDDGGNIPTCSYNVLYREKDHALRRPEDARSAWPRRAEVWPLKEVV